MLLLILLTIAALLAAGNWLGVAIRQKHAASLCYGITALFVGIYFLVALIGAGS